MDCRRFRAKPSNALMLANCWLKPYEHISVYFSAMWIKLQHFSHKENKFGNAVCKMKGIINVSNVRVNWINSFEPDEKYNKFYCIQCLVWFDLVLLTQTILTRSMGFISTYDDVITWKCFPHYWPSVRGIHRSSVDSSLKVPAMRSVGLFDVS